MEDHGTWQSRGVLQILDLQDGLRVHAGPDHWNDADMMEVGNGGMTVNEDRAHFTIWAMLASPLIAGNDIRNMSKETAAILTNKAVIALNQDPLGVQAFKYAARDGVEYWFKPLRGRRLGIHGAQSQQGRAQDHVRLENGKRERRSVEARRGLREDSLQTAQPVERADCRQYLEGAVGRIARATMCWCCGWHRLR